MRQAGRYLPEYQAVRAKHSFLEVCKKPELAAEVSVQPYRVLGVDAVIVFSDILIVAEAMGIGLEVPDSGPVLLNPVRDAASVARLHDFDPWCETKFVGDAIRTVCKEVGSEVPVIGFAAAPWTLACYMIEGQIRGNISLAKAMLREQSAVLRELLDRIARATAKYLASQIEAGAAAVQLFDTWAGELSPTEYDEFELPATRMIFDMLRVHEPASASAPKILFVKGPATSLEGAAKTDADVLSVDWKTDLAEARRRLGDDTGLQGNVDPRILLKGEEEIVAAARVAVEKTGGLGHILNLGHGILPNTPVANAKLFVEAGQTALIPAQAQPGGATSAKPSTE